MYHCNQTLKHKKTNELIRLVPTEGDTAWKWDLSDKTLVVDEFGNHHRVDIDKYTHVEDEFGRGYSKQPKKGQFVDESAKKYLVSKDELMKMREESLLRLEQKILGEMERNNIVMHPFSDGSRNWLLAKFFLKQRKAKCLFEQWNDFYDGTEGFEENHMYKIFTYKGKLWVVNRTSIRACKLC